MVFQEFVTFTKDHIKTFLPEKYADCKVEIKKIDKVNSSYTGLQIGREGEAASAVINLDAAYRDLDHMSPALLVSRIAGSLPENPPVIDLDGFTDYEKVKSSLFVRASNREKSSNFLATAPHKTIDELALTYHILISRDGEGVASASIGNTQMEVLGIDPETLHKDAVENSMRLFPPCLLSLNDKLIGGLLINERPRVTDFASSLESFSLDAGEIWVLTNNEQMNGAASMFYPGVLAALADQAQSDFFIIPSSVHEVLLMKKDDSIPVEAIRQMIREVNATIVTPEEILADEPYYYDHENQKIVRAESCFPDPARYMIYPDRDEPEPDDGLEL